MSSSSSLSSSSSCRTSRPRPIILKKNQEKPPLLRILPKVNVTSTVLSSSEPPAKKARCVAPPLLADCRSKSINSNDSHGSTTTSTITTSENLTEAVVEEEKHIFCLFCPITFPVKDHLEAREHYIDHFVILDAIGTHYSTRINNCSDTDNYSYECRLKSSYSYTGNQDLHSSVKETQAHDHNYHCIGKVQVNQENNSGRKQNPREKKNKKFVSDRVNEETFDWICRFIKYQIKLIYKKHSLPRCLFKDCPVCEGIAIIHKLPTSRIRVYRKTDFERHFRSHLKYGIWFCKLCRDYSNGTFYTKWLLKFLAVPWSTCYNPDTEPEKSDQEQSSEDEEQGTKQISASPHSRSKAAQSSTTPSTDIRYRKIKEATKYSATRAFKPHYVQVFTHIRNHHLCKKNKRKRKGASLSEVAVPITSVIGVRRIPALEQLISVTSDDHIRSLDVMKRIGMRTDPSHMAMTGDRRHFYTITEDDWNDIMEIIECDKENERTRREAQMDPSSSETSGLGSSATLSICDSSPTPSVSTTASMQPSSQGTGLSTSFRGLMIWSRRRDPNSILADTPTSSVPTRRLIRLRRSRFLRLNSSSVPPVFNSVQNGLPWKRKTNNSASVCTDPSMVRRRLIFDSEKSNEENLPVSKFGQALSSADYSKASNKRTAGRPFGSSKKRSGKGIENPDAGTSRHTMVTRRKGRRKYIPRAETSDDNRKTSDSNLSPRTKEALLDMIHCTGFSDDTISESDEDEDMNANDLSFEMMKNILSDLRDKQLPYLCPNMVSSVLSDSAESTENN